MLQATLALAQRVERMEIDFCASLARVGQPGGGSVLDVGGGRAVVSAPGAPMNKVLGLGLGRPVTDDELDEMELFYDERETPIQVELCPLATPDLPSRLSTRGYALKGFENELGCALPVRVPPVEGLRVDVITGEGNADEWLQVTAEGFSTPDSETSTIAPPPETMRTITGIMRRFVHPDIVRYLGWVGGVPAGAAGSAIVDGVLGIFGTATRPEFRRRGVQAAVVAAALRGANGRADLAIATTEPGSISQRTFERFGFQVLYTRAILVRT